MAGFTAGFLTGSFAIHSRLELEYWMSQFGPPYYAGAFKFACCCCLPAFSNTKDRFRIFTALPVFDLILLLKFMEEDPLGLEQLQLQ